MAIQLGQTQLYIDAANIREDLKNLGIAPWFGPRELTRPLNNLRIDGRNLAIRRIYFYDAIDEQAATAEEHRQHLHEVGLLPDTIVKLGRVTGKRERRQKGVDTRMVLDMMIAAQSGSVDYVALASGDADFEPVIQEIQRLGPKVLVLAFRRSLASSLAQAAERVIPLEENTDRIWSINKP